MTRYTVPDNLPIPDDYQDPADSPTVIGALGDAVQTALNTKSNTTHTHFRAGRPGTSFPIDAEAATGDIVIAHGLGRIPTVVLVSADDDGGACSVFASVRTFDATNIYAHMRNIGGAEAHVYINWFAM